MKSISEGIQSLIEDFVDMTAEEKAHLFYCIISTLFLIVQVLMTIKLFGG